MGAVSDWRTSRRSGAKEIAAVENASSSEGRSGNTISKYWTLSRVWVSLRQSHVENNTKSWTEDDMVEPVSEGGVMNDRFIDKTMERGASKTRTDSVGKGMKKKKMKDIGALDMFIRSRRVQRVVASSSMAASMNGSIGPNRMQVEVSLQVEAVVASGRTEEKKKFSLTLIITDFFPSPLSDNTAFTAHQSNSTELPMR